MMNTRRINKLKALLEARRAALLQTRQNNVHGENDLLAEKEPDVLDRGAERSAAAVLGRLADAELAEVLRIDAALARMETDRWGICESCGDRIEDARLNAMPEASRCVDCEAGLEQRTP